MASIFQQLSDPETIFDTIRKFREAGVLTIEASSGSDYIKMHLSLEDDPGLLRTKEQPTPEPFSDRPVPSAPEEPRGADGLTKEEAEELYFSSDAT